MLKTIMSYPERGKYGDNKYRGNCSGELIKDLLLHFKPGIVFDPAVGSGTSKQVCDELGIKNVCLDLNPAFGGFDVLKDEIPVSSDFIFFHPPYHNIIQYSGNMWGRPDPRDLSRCSSYEEFIRKLNLVQAKLITSLRKGGHIAILVGDVKKNGILYSIQKDLDWYGQPLNVLIKVQYNVWSDNQTYSNRLIKIVHEYCLLFKRDDCYVLPVKTVKQISFDLRNSKKISWRDVVLAALTRLGGKASLEMLYKEIQGHKKTESNPHWKEKVRQVVQEYKDFISVARGEYSLAA